MMNNHSPQEFITLDEFKRLMTLDELVTQDNPRMMEEFMSLSKKAPNQESLARTLQNNTNIDFEFIELSSEYDLD